MNDFAKKLARSLSTPHYDLEKDEHLAQEVRAAYDKKLRKATINCYLRLLAAAAITIYGAIGIKYNTGRYIEWALFTALVGFACVVLVIGWWWLLQAKLSIQREIKQLHIEVSTLLEERKA